MIEWINFLLALLIISNLIMLGSSRLGFCIKAVAFQGIILGILPLLVEAPHLSLNAVIISLSAFTLKGIVFPWLLFRALNTAQIRREVEPYVGFVPSLVIGILILIGSLSLSRHMGLLFPSISPLAVPLAFFTIATGLFIIVTRKKAVTMVLGYIVLENGIYAFGVAIATHIPLVVELGVLLDVFVAVFAMGIATYHISREFDHVDVDQLDKLKG